MTNFWFLVCVTGVLIILIGALLTPTAYAVVYLVGGGMAATGMTVSVLHEIDRRRS